MLGQNQKVGGHTHDKGTLKTLDSGSHSHSLLSYNSTQDHGICGLGVSDNRNKHGILSCFTGETLSGDANYYSYNYPTGQNYVQSTGSHSHNLEGSVANNGEGNENLPKNFTFKLWFRKF